MSREAHSDHFNTLVRYSRRIPRPLTVLHIGTNDLNDYELEWYFDLKKHTQDSLRLVFVEPQPAVLRRLQERVRNFLGLLHSPVQFLEAALCSEERSEVVFYTVSERIYKDFPKYLIPRSMIARISSLSRLHVIDLIMRFAHAEDFLERPELVEAYIEQTSVRCRTANGLMQEVGLNPAEVDVFVSDLEGYDTQLLPYFLELEGFRPASLTFEHLWQLAPELVTRWAVRDLALRGYTVHCHFADVVALSNLAQQELAQGTPGTRGLVAGALLPSFAEEVRRFGSGRGNRDIEFAFMFVSPCLPLVLATHMFGMYDYHNCPLRKISLSARLENIEERDGPIVLPAGSIVMVDTDSLPAFLDFSSQLQSPVVLVVGRHRRSHWQRQDFQLKSVLEELLRNTFIRHIFMQNPELQHPDYEALPMGFNPDQAGSLTHLGRELALAEEEGRLTMAAKRASPASSLVHVSFLTRGTTRRHRPDWFPSGLPQNFSDYTASLARALYVTSPAGDRFECYRHWEAVAFRAVPISNLPEHLYGSLFCESMEFVHTETMLNKLLSMSSHEAWARYRQPSRDILTVRFWRSRIALATQKAKGQLLPSVCASLRH